MLAVALACATPSAPIDPGALKGSVYRNEAFGFEVQAPAGWAFLTNEEVAAEVHAATGDGTELLKGALFHLVDRGTQPAAHRARRAVTARAETVKGAPKDVTSEVFADQLENTLRNGGGGVVFGPRRQAIVAGRRFVVIATEVSHAGLRAKLDHYVRYEGGRLLVLTFSYPPEESGPPQNAIESIRPLASKGTP